MRSITSQDQKESRIRVLEVIGNAGFGGMENYINNLVKHLSKHEFQITCICPYESAFTNSLRDLGTKVYVTPIYNDPVWRSIQLAIEIAHLHNIDVLHAHIPKAHLLAGLTGCLAGKPVVATIHGTDISSYEFGIARAVQSRLITNCQEAYTQALAMGVPPNYVSLIHNGVDSELFTPNGARDRLRKMIGIDADIPLVGFVGRLDHEKGPDLFLRSAQQVHHLRPDIHFVVVGEGTMKPELIKMHHSLGLKNHIHFIDWQYDMPSIYRDLDLLVHTSRSDGTSLALLEGMSCAIPVIVMAVGGVREIVEEKVTGLLAGPEDWEAVSELILQIFSDRNLMRNMGKAARIRVQKKFNVITNAGKVAKILQESALINQNSIDNKEFTTKMNEDISFGNSAAGG